MLEEALAVFKEQGGAWGTLGQGISYAKMGRLSEARQNLEAMIELSNERFISPYLFALFYIALGDVDKGFEMLDIAFRERESRMGFLKIDPSLDDVRSDPRFKALLKKMNLE
jgi:tetratricopeptide (TPR) repeat protein